MDRRKTTRNRLWR